ncbi:hypothetical protein WMY93_009752 [Mugilogobius chulae]|uniref:Uncharacterized protein n=1 Tax=Mugilogobius chulae TaxID=88201 RepID=A0AAW0PN12_9GOBI
MAYNGGYLGVHHTFTAGCFDSTTPSAPSTLSQRRLKRKQSAKGKTDPVEVITLT